LWALNPVTDLKNNDAELILGDTPGTPRTWRGPEASEYFSGNTQRGTWYHALCTLQFLSSGPKVYQYLLHDDVTFRRLRLPESIYGYERNDFQVTLRMYYGIDWPDFAIRSPSRVEVYRKLVISAGGLRFWDLLGDVGANVRPAALGCMVDDRSNIYAGPKTE
jgi:hypothetical protein